MRFEIAVGTRVSNSSGGTRQEVNPLEPAGAKVTESSVSDPPIPSSLQSSASDPRAPTGARRAWIITLAAMAVTLAAALILSYFAQLSYQQSEQRLTTLQTN